MDSKSKKICFLCVNERVINDFLIAQAQALFSAGFEVCFISNFLNKNAWENKTGFKCFDVKIPRGPSPLRILKSIRRSKKIFKDNHFDAIQYTGPTTSLIGAIAGKRAKVKRRIYCQWGLRFEGFRGIKRCVFKLIEKLTCKLSTSVFVDSKLNLKKEIHDGIVKANKVSIIYNGSTNGVDIKRIDSINREEQRKSFAEKYSLPKHAFLVGYLGRVAADKGINDLLNAIVHIGKIDNLYFAIAGFEDERDPIDQRLKERAISLGNTIFTGLVTNPEEMMACFDMFVFPSYREGYGGGCLLAGAYGLVPVISNIDPLLESTKFGEFAHVVETRQPSSLASTILRNINNPDDVALGCQYKDWIKDNFDRQNWLNAYKREIGYLLEGTK